MQESASEVGEQRPIRAVLFDAVGTLFHSTQPIERVYANAGRRWGAELDEAAVAARFSPAFFRHFTRVAPGADETLTVTSEVLEKNRWRAVVGEVFRELNEKSTKAVDDLFEQLWGHFAKGASWRLFADVEPTWSELKRRGIIVGIASNYDSRLIRVVNEMPPLNDCAHVFHSAAVGHAKPGREFFRTIERSIGIPRDELLFVGDDFNNDFAGANEAGWRALWLKRASATSSDPHRIASLKETLHWIDSSDSMSEDQ
jgi:putative hydrolase of the HAD superfamily